MTATRYPWNRKLVTHAQTWILMGVIIIVLNSCQTAGEGTVVTSSPEPTANEKQATAPEGKKKTQGNKKKSIIPEVPKDVPPVDVSMYVNENNTISENMAAIGDVMRAIEGEFGARLPPEDDPRRKHPLFARFYSTRNKIYELYSEGEFTLDQHMELCNNLQRFGLFFNELATQHCELFIAHEESEKDRQTKTNAIGVLASLHLKAQRYKDAAEIYRQYIDRECSLERQNEQLERLPPECRKLITYNLPFVLHRMKDTDAMEQLLEEVWAYGYEKPQDTFYLRSYLLQDLWSTGNLDSIDRLTKEILKLKIWGKNKAPSNNEGLVAAALSARARLLYLRKGCYKARSVYLDYEFDNGEIKPEWHQDNIKIPVAALCQKAPAVNIKEWVNNKKPQVLPGKPKLDLPILLHMVDAQFPASLVTLKFINTLAKDFEGKAQVISLVKPSNKFFNSVTMKNEEDLDAEGFKKALMAFCKDADITQPISASEVEPVLKGYLATQFFPTIVLIDKENTIVAYSAGLPYDEGWKVLLESMTKK